MNGIWVRSQCRKMLAFVSYMQTEDDGRLRATHDGAFITLGDYPTEARALEVLDEIQGHIDWCIPNDGGQHCNPQVYQMPAE